MINYIWFMEYEWLMVDDGWWFGLLLDMIIVFDGKWLICMGFDGMEDGMYIMVNNGWLITAGFHWRFPLE